MTTQEEAYNLIEELRDRFSQKDTDEAIRTSEMDKNLKLLTYSIETMAIKGEQEQFVNFVFCMLSNAFMLGYEAQHQRVD